VIYIDDHIGDFDLEQALQDVSRQRREHALRYRQERDRRCSVAVYKLLQRALLEEYGIDGKPVLALDENDKPQLADHPGIYCSMSHCRLAVACAVSDRPVGIDIEATDHYSEDVARHVMSEEEMKMITLSSRPEVTFTRLWTMKESLFKLTGDDRDGDIAHMLDEAGHYRFTTVVATGYLCTTCQKREEATIS